MPKKPQSVLLDTSVILEYFKENPTSAQSKLSKALKGGRSYAAYFTIIEINSYCIVEMIKLHEAILEYKDSGTAIKKMSNAWGRAPKYHMILIGLLLDEHSSINHKEYRKFAAQVEATIVDFQDRLYNLVSQFEGHFSDHPIVKSRVLSNNDFSLLRADVTVNKIDYDEVFRHYKKQLQFAADYFIDLKTQKKLLVMERDVEKLVNEAMNEPPTLSDKKHRGDLIVSLSSSKGRKILAHDVSFATIAPSLGKDTEYIDFDTL